MYTGEAVAIQIPKYAPFGTQGLSDKKSDYPYIKNNSLQLSIGWLPMVDATRWAHQRVFYLIFFRHWFLPQEKPLSPRNRSKLLVSGVNGSHVLTILWTQGSQGSRWSHFVETHATDVSKHSEDVTTIHQQNIRENTVVNKPPTWAHSLMLPSCFQEKNKIPHQSALLSRWFSGFPKVGYVG